MKKLSLHITLFLIPVLVILILYPVNKRQRYLSLKDDCFNHGVWLHDRIFENTIPVDIAFIGSSHTINGIDDKLIETELGSFNKKCHVLNMGYCRLGRNMHYTLLKELLKEKKPKVLVLEVTESENRYSHPIFPYVAEQKDALLPTLFFNKDVLKDMYTAVAFKTQLMQEDLFSQKQSPPIDLTPYGFSGHADTAKATLLDSFYVKRNKPEEKQSELARRFYNTYPLSYLQKMEGICKENQIQLYFLYMPAYGVSSPPAEKEYYQAHGKLLCPPYSIFEKKEYWFDENHLNFAGTKALSKWVSGQLK